MNTTVSVEASAKAGDIRVYLTIEIEGKALGWPISNIDNCVSRIGLEVVEKFTSYSTAENYVKGKMVVIRKSSNLNEQLVRLTNDISSMNAEYFKQYPEVETKFEVIAYVP